MKSAKQITKELAKEITLTLQFIEESKQNQKEDTTSKNANDVEMRHHFDELIKE